MQDNQNRLPRQMAPTAFRSSLLVLLLVCLWRCLSFSARAEAPNFYPVTVLDDGTPIDSNPIGTRMPLLLVHGIQEGPNIWDDFLKNGWASIPALKSNFKPYIFTYTTETTSLASSDPQTVTSLAQWMGAYIENNPGQFNGRPFAIIAHSMGGLIARTFMAEYRFQDRSLGGDKTAVLITLATPHHGSPIADAFFSLPTLNTANSYFFHLAPSFALDLVWDDYNGLSYAPYVVDPYPTTYADKIVAVGAETTFISTLEPDFLLSLSWEFLDREGYQSDGVVPIGSALFLGSQLHSTYQVDGDCDHDQITSGNNTVSTVSSAIPVYEAPIFSVISYELNSVSSLSSPPTITTVTPPGFTGSSQRVPITITGSGFTATSTLLFNGSIPSTSTYLTVNPPNKIIYCVSVGTQAATWTVQVVNGGVTSAPANFFVLGAPDTTPPPAPTLTVSPATGVSRKNQFYLSWANPSDPSGIARVWLKVGNSTPQSFPLPAFNPLPVVLPLSEGKETVSVWLEDGAGNESQVNAASTTLTLDVTPPVVTITSPASQTYSTTQSSISVSGTYSDNLSGVTAMVWTDDQNSGGNAVSQTGTGTAGTWNCTITNLANGLNNISIIAVDAAGNVGVANIQITYLNGSNTGSLNVGIAPTAAVSAGGQWQIVGDTTWHNPGTVSGIPVGNQQIQFLPINGWSTPPTATVNVQAGLTTPYTGTYTPANVNQPPGPVSNPSPANGAPDVGRINPMFTFTRGSLQDVLDFEFLLSTNPNPQVNPIEVWPYGTVYGETVQLSRTLDAATTYYWQVNSRDDNTGLETDGPVWSFTTEYTYPDLAVTSLSLDGTVAPGSNVTLYITAANLGTFTADVENVYFYLSRTPGAKSVRLNLPNSLWLNPPLAPGQSTNINFVVTLSGLQAGQSFVDASIEPFPGAVVTDPNLGNNLMSIPISYLDTTPPQVTSVNLSSPYGLKTGLTNYIDYFANDDTGVASVDFFYSTNGGLNWTPIQEGYIPPVNPEYGANYLWPIPTNFPVTTNLEIRVVAWDASGNSGEAVAGPYSVLDGTLPAVTVVSPNGGEAWDMGSTHQIQWAVSSANPIAYVTILFYFNNTAEIIAELSSPTGNTYQWTLPNDFSTTTGQIRVEVTDVNGNESDDWSDGYFSVLDNSAPPPAPWTTPLILQTNATGVKIATDSAGNVHMIYGTASGFSYTKRTGTNWSNPVGISAMPAIVNSFSLAVDSHQNPHVAWSSYANSTQNQNTQDIFYSYFNGASWSAATNISGSILGGYNVNSLTWGSGLSLPLAAANTASCVLNGKLYVLGIGNLVGLYQFDPIANTWTQKATMPGNGLQNPAAVGVNGIMYVAGQPSDGVNFRIYNPTSDSWTTGTAMPTTRGGLGMTSVNGEIYAVGGWVNGTVYANNEMYDPTGNVWTIKANLPTPCGFAGVASVGTKFYVVDGEGANSSSLRSVQVYDPSSNTWLDQSTNGPAPGFIPNTWPAKEGALACVLNNRIYLCGGVSGGGDTNTVDEYDPASNTWQSMNPMQSARAFFGGATIGSTIYVAGGVFAFNKLTSVEQASITSSTVGTVSSSQSIAIDTNDTVHFVWNDGAYYQPDETSFTGFTEVGTNAIYYTSKTSSGVWSPLSQLTSLWTAYPALCVDRSNTVHLSFEGYPSNGPSLMYMNKSNASWSVPIALASQNNSYYYLGMVADSSNHLHFAWRWFDVANSLSRIMHGFFDGVNPLTNEIAYSSAGALYPTINVDSFARPHITLEDQSSYPDVLLYTYKSGNTWSSPIQLNLNSQSVAQGSSDAAIAAVSNELHVVWQSSVNGTSAILYNDAFVGSTNDTFPPSVSVLSPSDGQVLAIASTFNVQWQAVDNVGVAMVSLDYSTNGGTAWTMIATNQPNTGAFAWFVPNCGTNLTQVRITALDAAGNAGYGYSGSFSTANLTPPSIAIISPTNGATLTGNTVVPVLWNASDNVAVTSVYLEYSLNNGSTWLALTNDPSNSGSFSWLVPNSATPTLLLRATAKDSAGFTAVAVTAQPLSIVRGNNPPIAPYNPFPLAGGINVPFTAPILQWQSGDVDGDSLTYQVLLGTNATPPYAANLAQSSFPPGFLAPQTKYYWQVLVSDGKATTTGPIWTFTTQAGSRPQAVISGQTMMSNGVFQFQFSGIFGQNYALQASTNLVNWVTITNVVVTETPALAVDPNAGNYGFRFYRLADQIGGPTIYISSFQRLPNHATQFQVNGVLGQTYAIQISADLVNWTNLSNVTLTNSPAPFSDSNSATVNRRFYRLISQ